MSQPFLATRSRIPDQSLLRAALEPNAEVTTAEFSGTIRLNTSAHFSPSTTYMTLAREAAKALYGSHAIGSPLCR